MLPRKSSGAFAVDFYRAVHQHHIKDSEHRTFSPLHTEYLLMKLHLFWGTGLSYWNVQWHFSLRFLTMLGRSSNIRPWIQHIITVGTWRLLAGVVSGLFFKLRLEESVCNRGTQLSSCSNSSISLSQLSSWFSLSATTSYSWSSCCNSLSQSGVSSEKPRGCHSFNNLYVEMVTWFNNQMWLTALQLTLLCVRISSLVQNQLLHFFAQILLIYLTGVKGIADKFRHAWACGDPIFILS